MNDVGLQIAAVDSKRALKDFIRVPWEIYRDDPNWVPPLLFERRQALSPSHPFFDHAEWQAWVAYTGGRAVGRISAQIDRLHLERYRNATGHFGLIEAPDDASVFRSLFDVAEAWLRKRDMRRAAGPFNLGVNQEIGILVEGFATPPYFMMPRSRPYYDARIRQCGYRPAQDCLAYEIDEEAFALTQTMQRLLRRVGSRIRVRPLNRKQPKEDIAIIRKIFNDAWSDNWGFVEFTAAEFEAVCKELLSLLPPDFIQIAEVEGEPVAFIVLLPNVNEVIADLNGKLLPFGWAKLLWRLKVGFPRTARVPLMGVRQKYQNTRLGPALALVLIQALHQPALRKGVERAELSWILEDNQAMRRIIENIGGRVSKRYRMYQKELAFSHVAQP